MKLSPDDGMDPYSRAAAPCGDGPSDRGLLLALVIPEGRSSCLRLGLAIPPDILPRPNVPSRSGSERGLEAMSKSKPLRGIRVRVRGK